MYSTVLLGISFAGGGIAAVAVDAEIAGVPRRSPWRSSWAVVVKTVRQSGELRNVGVLLALTAF
jgi:hypothetical protein